MSASKINPQGVPPGTRHGGDEAQLSRDDGPVGDNLHTKTDRSFRIAFWNIMGLPVNPTSLKNKQLQDICTKHNIDALGIQEINLNFPRLSPSGQWKHRFHSFDGYTHYATNKHTTSTSRMCHGGTALFFTNSIAHRATAHGTDNTGLGRWCWSYFQGRNGI